LNANLKRYHYSSLLSVGMTPNWPKNKRVVDVASTTLEETNSTDSFLKDIFVNTPQIVSGIRFMIHMSTIVVKTRSLLTNYIEQGDNL
jgi:hypothetical protein